MVLITQCEICNRKIEVDTAGAMNKVGYKCPDCDCNTTARFLSDTKTETNSATNTAGFLTSKPSELEALSKLEQFCIKE